MSHLPPPGLFSRRLLLVEDDQLTQSLLERLLKQSGFDVLSAGSAAEAAEAAKQFDPDVMVVDISLGDGPNGLDLIRAMKNAYPHVAFVVLSNYAVAPSGLSDFTDVAYLRKRDIADPDILLQAVEQALRDRDLSESFPIAQATPISGLTTSQVEVLALIAKGLSNQEIASRRGTTVQGTEQLISRIYRSLGLRRDSAVSMRVQATSIYSSVTGL